MWALNGNLEPLPMTPETVLRGFVSINKHPDRNHPHISYHINYSFEVKKVSSKRIVSPNMIIPSEGETFIETTTRVSHGFPKDSHLLNKIKIPSNWVPNQNVDRNCPNELLKAIPMQVDGVKQEYKVWFSLLCAFSRTGITFRAF